MKKKDLVIVNAVSDILDIKKNNPNKLDSELMGILIDKNRKVKFTEENKLLWLSSANKALKLKTESPKMPKKEIIQKILDLSI